MAGGIGSKFNKSLGSMPMRADPGQRKPAPAGFGGRSGPMGGAWGGTPMGATGAPPAAAAAGRAALGSAYGNAQNAMRGGFGGGNPAGDPAAAQQKGQDAMARLQAARTAGAATNRGAPSGPGSTLSAGVKGPGQPDPNAPSRMAAMFGRR